MSRLNTVLKSTAVAVALISSGAASAAAYFNITTNYGTTGPANVISSNVDATSVYSAAGLPGATDFDQLIGRNDVSVADTSTNGEVNSWLDGTTVVTGGAGVIGTDYRVYFSYSLSGTAEVVDGLGIFADGTMDANNDGLIDSNAILGPGPVIIGGLDSIIPNYTTGSINLFYDDLADGADAGLKILQLNLISAEPDGTNVVLFADVDYGWYTDGTSSLVEDFFDFVVPVGGLTSFYDIWKSGQPLDPIKIVTRTDFNVDPNLVPTSIGGGEFARTTNLNLTTTVQAVPEPASLALLGLGLLGLGAIRRKNAKA